MALRAALPYRRHWRFRSRERNDTFSSEATPKPSPYYRIVIQATGEGHISRTILWVPSKKLWFDAEDVTPPLAGYWRTAHATSPALTALAAKVKLFPAPKRWILPALLVRFAMRVALAASGDIPARRPARAP